jgi:signal transduction histidine kinase
MATHRPDPRRYWARWRPARLRPLHRYTVRARMAMLYGVVSALVGIVPVALICVLIQHDLGRTVITAVDKSGVAVTVRAQQAVPATKGDGTSAYPTRQGIPAKTVLILVPCATKPDQPSMTAQVPRNCAVVADKAQLLDAYPAREASALQLGSTISGTLVRQLLGYSALALAVLIMLAFGLGWWVAGRALRPVHEMAAAARRLSSANLHQRIPLHRQPRDELRDLGESFNALLDRLGAAFASQQRFVANAAHELRTPLAIQRATIQIGLGEYPIDADELASVRDELLTANRRHERLIDGLLMLARGERGLEQLDPVELDQVAEDVLPPLAAQAAQCGVELTVRTEPVVVDGDAVLLGQLLTNLVQNAIRYNHESGRVEVRVARSSIVVSNTGPVVPADAIDDLFEPFRRLHPDRTGSATGAGLGLSIVRSIATAHGGTVTARPNAIGGGLTVRVGLPARQSLNRHGKNREEGEKEPAKIR